jgi:hypothetical protein
MKANRPYFKKISFIGIIPELYILVILIILLSFSVIGETSPKFLIFHLDAVSSQYFSQNMKDGYLPNLKAVFENGHIIHYGLSLFPGGTEMIYPRLKKGLDSSNRDKERVIPGYKTWSYMFSHIPRRARDCFLYGIPGLDFFMFLPLLNVPELLETYGVIEIIWFTTDALGHMLGQRLYRASIRRFDRYFGNLVKKLNLNEVNLIVYSDHGMSFGDFTVIDQGKEIKRIVGNNLRAFLHPNLYLKNPDTKDKVARDIVLGSEIDFTFYMDDFHRMIGYFDQGKVIFEEKEGKFRYLFEGKDAFG